jgi:hypothetical protein
VGQVWVKSLVKCFPVPHLSPWEGRGEGEDALPPSPIRVVCVKFCKLVFMVAMR